MKITAIILACLTCIPGITAGFTGIPDTTASCNGSSSNPLGQWQKTFHRRRGISSPDTAHAISTFPEYRDTVRG